MSVALRPECFLTVIALLSAYAIDAIGSDVGILVDGSDSMRGFFAAGSLQDSMDQVLKSSQRTGLSVEAKVFLSNRGDNRLTTVDYDSFIEQLAGQDVKPRLFGTTTLLDLAYKGGSQISKILFILTDNIHQEEEVNTRAFYRQFGDPDIEYIYLIPEILDFYGPVFFERRSFVSYQEFKNQIEDGRFDGQLMPPRFREGEHSLIAYYRGKRGLVIYSILLDENLRERYFEMLRSLKEMNREVLLVKPIDSKHVEIQGVEDEATAWKVMEDYYNRHPVGKNTLTGELPNMALVSSFDNNIRKNLLIPLSDAYAPRFRLDAQNLIRFWFTLSSRLSHINIGKFNGAESSNVRLSVSDPSFLVEDDAIGKYLRIPKPVGSVIPPCLLGTLPAVSNTGEVFRNKYYYISEVVFGPFEIDWSLGAFFCFLRNRSIPAFMSFNIRMTVPPQEISMTKDFESRYFTYDLMKLDRIYTPVDLFTYLSKEPINIDIEVNLE